MAVTEEIEKKVLAEASEATPNYSVDYNDPRFGKWESEKQQELTENEQLYGGMIAETDKFYDGLKQESQDWADKQTALQQEQTDFAIEKIEQQKDQANQDYKKEQSASYVDWQKQSNQYGANAEKMASAGLTNTGYSESSQVSMYNTYQNRVATAREVYNRAVLQYDNAIKDAILQNNYVLAEIAHTALKEQLTLALDGFQYKNSLIEKQANQKTAIKDRYYARWQDTLQQINTENALKWDIDKYYDNQAWETKQNQINRDWQSTENQKSRDFQAAQAKLERKHQNEGRIEKSVNVPSFSNFQKAATYMKSKGVPSEYISDTLEYSDWVRKKGSYEYTGIGGNDVKNYNTYTDYLTARVQYAVAEYGN